MAKKRIRVQVNVMVDKALAVMLDDKAKSEGVSRSDVVRHAILKDVNSWNGTKREA